MLGDKNLDEREGDSYKTAYFVRTDLVAVYCDKNPGDLLFCRGDGFTF